MSWLEPKEIQRPIKTSGGPEDFKSSYGQDKVHVLA